MIAFGPVPSRRLGRSLGINNIPPKVCTYACVYCQLGRQIELLQPLGIPIAVISNASLIWRADVRAALRQADWVSLKVDATAEEVWRKIGRPYGTLRLAAGRPPGSAKSTGAGGLPGAHILFEKITRQIWRSIKTMVEIICVTENSAE